MNERAAELPAAGAQPRRVKLERQQREPLYDACGSVSDGLAARKLGAGCGDARAGQAQLPPPAPRAGGDFVILEGEGTLRGRRDGAGARRRRVFSSRRAGYPHQFINTSDAPMRYLGISAQEQPELCDARIRARWPAISAGCASSSAGRTTGTGLPTVGRSSRAEPLSAAGANSRRRTAPMPTPAP